MAELLRDRELTVATAESLTGGLVGAKLTDAGGSSDFYAGSLVCYTHEAKAVLPGSTRPFCRDPAR